MSSTMVAFEKTSTTNHIPWRIHETDIFTYMNGCFLGNIGKYNSPIDSMGIGWNMICEVHVPFFA